MPSHCALRVLENLAVGTGLLLWIWDLGESDCVALGAAITVGESGSRRCGRASLGEFGLCKWQAWHKHLLGKVVVVQLLIAKRLESSKKLGADC